MAEANYSHAIVAWRETLHLYEHVASINDALDQFEPTFVDEMST